MKKQYTKDISTMGLNYNHIFKININTYTTIQKTARKNAT